MSLQRRSRAHEPAGSLLQRGINRQGIVGAQRGTAQGEDMAPGTCWQPGKRSRHP